jgi:hypothetical protein
MILADMGPRSSSSNAPGKDIDLIAQGMGGIMHVTSEPDGPPTSVGLPICDLGTGMWAVQGTDRRTKQQVGLLQPSRHRDRKPDSNGSWCSGLRAVGNQHIETGLRRMYNFTLVPRSVLIEILAYTAIVDQRPRLPSRSRRRPALAECPDWWLSCLRGRQIGCSFGEYRIGRANRSG